MWPLVKCFGHSLPVFLHTGATDKNGQPFDVQQQLRATTVVERMYGEDENIQVNGYTFILDFTGFGTKHMMQMSMEDMRNWNSCWQVCIG